MLETLGWIMVVLTVTLLTIGLVNTMWQKARRSDRANMRRLIRYMDALPPARPW